MQAIHRNLGQALQTLATPTETPPTSIDVESYFANWCFTGAETRAEHHKLSKMLEAAKTFCRAFLAKPDEPYWLILSGPSGCGKTFLADCIRNLWIKHADRIYEEQIRPELDPARSNLRYLWSYRQQGPFFRKWIKSIDVIRDGNYHRVAELSDDWCKIIDDFGAESVDREGKPTNFVVGQMTKICDARLGKWTVLTTNFSRRDFGDEFDVRIASRLIRGGNICIHCDARDFNIRKLQRP